MTAPAIPVTPLPTAAVAFREWERTDTEPATDEQTAVAAERGEEQDTPAEPDAPPAPRKRSAPRLASLDIFRGLTIAGMLLVNNVSLGGQTPAQLMHGEWSGRVNYADLVFPWFLLIVGVAVPYAQASARRRHWSRFLPGRKGLHQDGSIPRQYEKKALGRALSLVALGCFLDSLLQKRLMLDLGVLQIIGLAYFTAVLIGDLLSLRGRLLAAAALLIGHFALLRWASAPGIPAGTLTENADVLTYFYKTYLPPVNMGFVTFSLKGILSVIPTTAMVLIGTAAGDLLRRKKISAERKAFTLLVCGAGLAAFGTLWSHWQPMLKPVWTAPYICYAAGLGCALLAVLYYLVDGVQERKAARLARAGSDDVSTTSRQLPVKLAQRNLWGWLLFPFTVFGMNAIVAYVAPIAVKAAFLRNIYPRPGVNSEQWLLESARQSFGTITGGWVYTLGYIAVWWLVLFALYKKRWFLRV